jgi:hypothetical protein
MPITFEPHPEENYFVSKWQGRIVGDEILPSYQRFYESEEWVPTFNELADLSEADLTDVRNVTMLELCQYTVDLYRKNGIDSSKSAAYAPGELPEYISHLYGAFAFESPEKVRVFKDRDKAVKWLMTD